MIHDITWRKYRQSDVYYRDLDAIVELHLQQETALGRRMDLPAMKPPVIEAWVAERDGEVVGGFYAEAVVEPVMFGRDPAVTASARRFAPVALKELQDRGYRLVRMEVPRWIGQEAEAINAELEKVGFRATDPDFYHYLYDLRRPSTGGNGRV